MFWKNYSCESKTKSKGNLFKVSFNNNIDIDNKFSFGQFEFLEIAVLKLRNAVKLKLLVIFLQEQKKRENSKGKIEISGVSFWIAIF